VSAQTALLDRFLIINQRHAAAVMRGTSATTTPQAAPHSRSSRRYDHSPSGRRGRRTPSDGATASVDCYTSKSRSREVFSVSGTHTPATASTHPTTSGNRQTRPNHHRSPTAHRIKIKITFGFSVVISSRRCFHAATRSSCPRARRESEDQRRTASGGVHCRRCWRIQSTGSGIPAGSCRAPPRPSARTASTSLGIDQLASASAARTAPPTP
jgi:hypothetical protein